MYHEQNLYHRRQYLNEHTDHSMHRFSGLQQPRARQRPHEYHRQNVTRALSTTHPIATAYIQKHAHHKHGTIRQQSLPRSPSPTESYELPYPIHQGHQHQHPHRVPSHSRAYAYTTNKHFPSPQHQHSTLIHTQRGTRRHHDQHRYYLSPTPSPEPMPAPAPVSHDQLQLQANMYLDDTMLIDVDDCKLAEMPSMYAPESKSSHPSYRKYKTRLSDSKQPKTSTKTRASESSSSQNKHRGTKKKTDAAAPHTKSKTKRKERAQSTVLCSSSEPMNFNQKCLSRSEESTVAIKVFEVERHLQYPVEMDAAHAHAHAHVHHVGHRTQTTRRVQPTHEHHYKSHSDALHRAHKHNPHPPIHPQHQHHHSHSHQLQHDDRERERRRILYGTTNGYVNRHDELSQVRSQQRHLPRQQQQRPRPRGVHFNEKAMDYMSPEQQLLYLFDHANTNRMSNISASQQTQTSNVTDNKSRATSMQGADAHSERMPSLSAQAPPLPPPLPPALLGAGRHLIAFSPPRSPVVLSPASTRAVVHSPTPQLQLRDHSHSAQHARRPLLHHDPRLWRVSNTTETRSHAQAITEDICLVTRATRVSAQFPNANVDVDVECSGLLQAITPFNKQLELTHASCSLHNSAYDEFIDVDHDAIGDDSPLLEIPASLTAEESAVCCIDIEDTDCDDDDEDDRKQQQQYTVMVNDEEWRRIHNGPNSKISHRLRHDIV